jgi:CRP-like cAMP-binding protein
MNFLDYCPESIQSFVQVLKYEPDEHLMRQGDPADYIYHLIEGELQCFAITEKGLRHIVYIYQPGEIVGEIEAFTNSPILTGVVATKPSRVHRIDRAHFIKWFDESPKFARYITTQMGYKLSNTFALTSMNLQYSIKKQFMQHLYHAQRKNSGAFYVDKKEIAAILGCHYRSINRIVQDLTEEGFIQYHKGTFKITNLAAFHEALRKQD